jgi:hypothetical protein
LIFAENDHHFNFIFRGQSNSDWSINSTATKRLMKAYEKKLNFEIFIEYHESLLKKAKTNSYDYKNNRKLNEMELLAEIQHYGGGTFLTDFTKSFLVALKRFIYFEK